MRSQGIFDDLILSLVEGEGTIYQALRSWVLANSPLQQEVEGRFYVTAV